MPFVSIIYASKCSAWLVYIELPFDLPPLDLPGSIAHQGVVDVAWIVQMFYIHILCLLHLQVSFRGASTLFAGDDLSQIGQAYSAAE